MNRYGLFELLAGLACLTLACLCAPLNLLPFTWTPTATPTLTFTPTFTLLPTDTPTLALTPAPVSLEISPECVSGLQEELHNSETTWQTGSQFDSRYTLVKYTVKGDEITNPDIVTPVMPALKTYQNDTAMQQKMWHFWANLIPADQRTEVTEFDVFTDGSNNVLGAVKQGDTPHEWVLMMDIQDSKSFASLSSTLIHEFAHVMTLNDTQLTPDLQVFDHPDDWDIYLDEEAACPTYFTFEGCSHTDSYLNEFFQTFWKGSLYEQWKKISDISDPDAQDQAIYEFYLHRENQFVSAYAATSPEEDIAETFMYFIFTPKPDGTKISEEKILYFYDHPEMETLRAEILSHLCTYILKP